MFCQRLVPEIDHRSSMPLSCPSTNPLIVFWVLHGKWRRIAISQPICEVENTESWSAQIPQWLRSHKRTIYIFSIQPYVVPCFLKMKFIIPAAVSQIPSLCKHIRKLSVVEENLQQLLKPVNAVDFIFWNAARKILWVCYSIPSRFLTEYILKFMFCGSIV